MKTKDVKDEILRRTDNGRQVFEHYSGGKKPKKNFLNPEQTFCPSCDDPDFIQILIKLWNLPCKFSSKSGRCPCNQCYLHHTPITSCSVYNYHFRCYYLLFRRLLFPPLLFFTFFEFLQFCFLFTPDMSDLIFLGLIKHFWSNPTRSMRPDFLSASMTRS